MMDVAEKYWYPKPITKDLLSRICIAYANGMTVKAIATDLQFSQANVRYLIDKYYLGNHMNEPETITLPSKLNQQNGKKQND